MEKKEISITYEVYENADALNADDAKLLELARIETKNAYAPYSNFLVGAAAKLKNGKFVSGTNQENASYPAGICAERVLLSAASSLYPGVAIDTLAISYQGLGKKSDHPVAPCGICRQSLVEFEQRFLSPVRLILGGMEGEIFIFSQAKDLLPLEFSGENLV